MPLPGRKPPTANPNAAKQETAPTGKSRLPALPQGGLKPRRSVNFVELPRHMHSCRYLLKVTRIDLGTNSKDNTERVECLFELLESDAVDTTGKPLFKQGAEIRKYLPTQGKQSLYFWQEFSAFVLAANGVASDDESLAEFQADLDANFTEVLEKGALTGCVVELRYKRGKNKEGKDTYYTDWQPADEADVVKYTKAS